jgi:alpha-amylase
MHTKLLTTILLITISTVTAAPNQHQNIHGVQGRDTIAFLFQWKWTDIAQECEQFLSKWGYAAVRVCCFANHEDPNYSDGLSL